MNFSNTAIVHIKSTFNNTLICVTNLEGNVIIAGSGGSTGLKGQKRSTYYAAQATSTLLAQKSFKGGIRKVYIRLNGFGDGREACIKSFIAEKIEILKIQDVTKIAHGGCKLPKKKTSLVEVKYVLQFIFSTRLNSLFFIAAEMVKW